MASPRYSGVEVKVGIFLAFCLALFVVMLITYGRFSPVWRGRAEIFVVFENVAGLRVDAPVRYNGLEVGRVKSIKILHLDETNIERLMPLGKNDLDNLPVWPEALRKKLRADQDADFERRLWAALKNRTMIELCLEVLQEGDVRRYRMDDRVRIVSTVLGDCGVEIIAGSGAVNTFAPGHLLLGTSGDFFSNLAKSMGDVKDILSNVTDVVGTQERRSFERAQARLVKISGRLDRLTAAAGKRADVTGKRADKLGGEIMARISEASKGFEKIQPDAERAASGIKGGLKGIQDHIASVQTEASAAMSSISKDAAGVRKDLSEMLAAGKKDFAEMQDKFPAIYDSFSNLSARSSEGRDSAGRMMSQSEQDLARAKSALANGLLYLQQTGQAAIENKDLMLSEKDRGEHEYATAVCVQRSLASASRHIREAGADAQEVLFNAASLRGTPTLSHGYAAVENVFKIGGKVDDLRRLVDDRLLPPYERKKAAWTEAAAAPANR